METVVDVAELITQAVFVLLGAIALWQWRRRGGRAAAWLAATFGSLAMAVVVGGFLPEEPEGALLIVVQLLIVLLALFPYFLYRFATAFVPAGRLLDVVAATATSAVAVWSFVLAPFPGPDEPQSAAFQAFVWSFLGMWTFLTGVVAYRLWRAGRGQATVARKRMRLLSIGSIALNVALLITALGPAGDEASPAALATQLVGIFSAGLFYFGFAPPSMLRVLWRRPEEAALRQTEVELMGTTSAADVASALLPHASRLLGGRGALVVADDGGIIGVHGIPEQDVRRIAAEAGAVSTLGAAQEVRPGLLGLRLRSGWLAVESSPYTPFFGREEIEILRGLGAFADLAFARARLFQQERKARLQVERANAELEGFVYSVSHDLRNPLISVLGYLDYLKEDYWDALGDEGRHFLSRIRSSATYMHELINDLLELSRVGRMQTETEDVDLRALISSLAEDLGASHPGTSVEVGALPVVDMNPVRARQLFTNLLTNAAVHGGRPDVRIRVGTARRTDGAAEIFVGDDGLGVPPEYREKVFGVFERLEGRSEGDADGTGIGLAICAKIVADLDGRIWIADAERGTDVRIELPAARVRSQPETMEA